MSRFTRITRRKALWLAVCLLPIAAVTASPPAADEALSTARLSADVKYLASDAMEGRGVGTRGLELAAAYIAEQFEATGLRTTVVDDGPFQEFEMLYGAELGRSNEMAFAGPERQRIVVKMGEEFTPVWFREGGDISGPLAFAGYGVEAPDQGYNDYDGLDVAGKVVLIMRQVPQHTNPHGPFAGPGARHADLRSKASTAYQHGAKAVIFVTNPGTIRGKALDRSGEQELLVQSVLQEGARYLSSATPSDRSNLEETIRNLHDSRTVSGALDDPLMPFGYPQFSINKPSPMPLVHVKGVVVDRLLHTALGTSLEGLETTIDTLFEPQSSVLEGWSVEGHTSIDYKTARVKNVLAVLDGEGPRANETIVVGAHYDHLGYGGDGSLAPNSKEIHNGADDNASGTAGILELARRLAQRSQPLPRRIVFIAFTAEERGLIGSGHYVNHPVFPLKDTVAMINLDMIGRLRDEKLIAAGTATGFDALLDDRAEKYGLKRTNDLDSFSRSDHFSFYTHKIPVMFFFTNAHADYHRPSDDWDKVDTTGMRRVVDLIEDVVVTLAESEQRPQYVELPPPARRPGAARPYFGSIPDFGRQAKGYAIQGVGKGSPAQKGGLKGGDIIVKVGDRQIGGLEDFDAALRAYKAGQTVAVVVVRDGKAVALKVTLGQPR